MFASSKLKVKEVTKAFRKLNLNVGEMHSDLEQSQRDYIMREFKNGRIHILIATDIVSRGIDIDDIRLVINYDVPNDCEDYVHRIGRTARANSKGDAFTLISPRDMLRIKNIEDLIEMQIPRLPLPEELGEAPIWKIEEKQPKKRFYKKTKSKSKNATHRNSQHNKR